MILPWVITLYRRFFFRVMPRFTHSLSSLGYVARLFDVLLLHPLMPIYVSAAVLIGEWSAN